MEREINVPRQAAEPGSGPVSQSGQSDKLRAEARDLLAAADRVLDAIQPGDAETYLQQNRQRGGQ